jgi:hypothetical protein
VEFEVPSTPPRESSTRAKTWPHLRRLDKKGKEVVDKAVDVTPSPKKPVAANPSTGD